MVGVPAVYYATPSTPLVTVEINYPTCGAREVRAPIPPSAVPDGPPEGSMTVMVTKTGAEWDFFKLTKPGVKPLSSGPDCRPTDKWAATVAVEARPGWNGSGTFRTAPRASGTLNGAGLIRPRDTKRPAGATWDHAVALAYPGTLAGAPVWPAVRNDGRCGDSNACVPLGARFQLDPTVSCGSWPSLDGEWQRQLCRTLQKYGLIVVDTGSALLAQHPVSLTSYRYPWEPSWRPLPADLAARLRLLDWAKWTGGSK